MATALGTTIALMIVFWPRLLEMYQPKHLLKPTQPLHHTARWSLLITVVVGAAGLGLNKYIEGPLRNPTVVAIGLILGAFYILAAEKLAKQTDTEPTKNQVLLTGASQILAFVPGMSRSGSSISTALLTGLKRKDAANLSFLLSVPITLLAILKQLAEFAHLLIKGEVATSVLPFYLVGAIAAGVVGYISLRWLLSLVANRSLSWFAPYRIILAIIILIRFH